MKKGKKPEEPVTVSEPDPEPEPMYWLMVSEAEAREVSAGRVPERVAEMARMAWDWYLETVGDNYTDRVRNQRRGL